MRRKQVFSIALFLVACDTGAEHGGGHGAAGMQVHMGRAPVVAKAAHADHADHADHGAEAEAAHAEAPSPESAAVEDPSAEAPAEAPEAEVAADEGETEGAPEADAEAEAPDADAEADAPEAQPEPAAEADAPAAAAGGRSEAEWTELAKVRLGSNKVDGALDPEVVRKTVRSKSKDLKACYAKGLVSSAELSGKLTMEFVVDKKGKMDSVKVKSSTLNNAAVESCATTTIEGWTFDAPEDGKKVKIRYSFTLSL